MDAFILVSWSEEGPVLADPATVEYAWRLDELDQSRFELRRGSEGFWQVLDSLSPRHYPSRLGFDGLCRSREASTLRTPSQSELAPTVLHVRPPSVMQSW